MAKVAKEQELELKTNPSFIFENSGIFYPAIAIVGVNGYAVSYRKDINQKLELGLDILEVPTRDLKLSFNLSDKLFDDGNLNINFYGSLLLVARNLAQISDCNFYSHGEINVYNKEICTFAPRLFRRIVNN